MKALFRKYQKHTVLSGLCMVLLLGLLAACGSNTPSASSSGINTVKQVSQQAANNSFNFKMVPSNKNIAACLPKASGRVTITPNELNDVMKVEVYGLAPKTEYDLFVIEQPGAPFGVSWYQSDIETDGYGNGSVQVRGIFDKETFSVSPGGSTTFKPTHQFHLGLWFNDPAVPFKLGCEPGAKAPIVTPFNGEQHAGVQVLNTSNFPLNEGPLSKVSR